MHSRGGFPPDTTTIDAVHKWRDAALPVSVDAASRDIFHLTLPRACAPAEAGLSTLLPLTRHKTFLRVSQFDKNLNLSSVARAMVPHGARRLPAARAEDAFEWTFDSPCSIVNERDSVYLCPLSDGSRVTVVAQGKHCEAM